MQPPLIGITTSRIRLRSGAVVHGATETYLKALARAGAHPVLLPLGLPEAALTALLARLDGILFTGGGDVHPQRYGSRLIPEVNSIDEDRDRVEIHLLQETVARQTPFLGICRGLQVINVALGGTLYEDIPAQHPDAIKHDYFTEAGWPRDHAAHAVDLEPGSRIAALLEMRSLTVNSLHHQGVRELAPGLLAAAYAPDGVLEAFELPTQPFGLAVQWHPECLPDDPTQCRLFEAFVRSAGETAP
jgi:putative glutamine amidotransferase